MGDAIKFGWLQKVITVINECVIRYVYQSQAQMDHKFFKNQFLANIKLKQKNQFIQKCEKR